MTIDKLIMKLSQYPPEQEVYIRYETYATRCIEDVQVSEAGELEIVAENF